MRLVSPYSTSRRCMQPGDIIAFCGKGIFSNIIRWYTKSEVSHIGIIFKSEVVDGVNIVDVFESTTLNDTKGVQRNRMSERVRDYNGTMWWLPLSDESRVKLDLKEMSKFLLAQNGKKYDAIQAVKSAMDRFMNSEDHTSFFCSELATAALEKGGVLKDVNSSEITPIDLCRFPIFKKDYYLVKGDLGKFIEGYNGK